MKEDQIEFEASDSSEEEKSGMDSQIQHQYQQKQEQLKLQQKQQLQSITKKNSIPQLTKEQRAMLLQQEKEELKRRASERAKPKEDAEPKKKGGIFGMFSPFSKLSKNEERHRNYLATKEIKLPKNFANLVLDQEMLIDSGQGDLDAVNKLMQMYSRAVEYYSGMNDERYLYFNERIQNLLCRPDIIKLMTADKSDEPVKPPEIKGMTTFEDQQKKAQDDLRQKELMSEQRKKARAEVMKTTLKQEEKDDPEFQQDQEKILEAQELLEKTKETLRTDAIKQKDSIAQRLKDRKMKLAQKRSSNSILDIDSKVFHRGGTQSVMVPTTKQKELKEQTELQMLLAKFQNMPQVNEEEGDPIILEEEDEEDTPEGKPTNTSSNGTFPLAQNPQSLIVKSSNPLKPADANSGFNFDLGSKSSAQYFVNEDEVADYEEKMKAKVQEMWASIEQRQEEIQKEYQIKLEEIIEEVAQLKFEQLAEIKVMYKKADPNDAELMKQKEQEIADVKANADKLKEDKMKEAQKELEQKKALLADEKAAFFKSINGSRAEGLTPSPEVSSGEKPVVSAAPSSPKFKFDFEKIQVNESPQPAVDTAVDKPSQSSIDFIKQQLLIQSQHEE